MSSSHIPRLAKKLYWVLGGVASVFIFLIWFVPIFVEDQMEVISLHHWLETESQRYANSVESGEEIAYPNPLEFEIYWQNKPKPNWLDAFSSPGFYEMEEFDNDRHFVVAQMPGRDELYYIVFKDEADDYLDEYEDKLQVFITLAVLILLFTVIVLSVYLARYFARPLERMAAKVKYMEPQQPDFQVDTTFYEIASIEKTMLACKQRINNYFEREQDFSRFSSHEIRTPLMVMQGSAQLLEKVPNQSPLQLKAIQRILTACDDVSLLTDTFLLLGKETIEAQFFEDIVLASVLYEQIDVVTRVLQGERPECNIQINSDSVVRAPRSFLVIAFRNIIKNALSYAHSKVQITLDSHRLVVENDFEQSECQKGYGYGLVILERIGAKLEWSLTIEQLPAGYRVSITFPD
ncbi:sensor histidine kinase [Alteromonas confluentis]|uniref:sensor histidine kinase n=1 Tax=Alteromonas confluentis TaxID=1656094 RepID=UPI0009F16F25|nr:HAMP domain-containing sensor histidine kinase [Alteromonas confluentis]